VDTFHENLASSLPHNDIQKYVDKTQWAVIYVIKDFMACIGEKYFCC